MAGEQPAKKRARIEVPLPVTLTLRHGHGHGHASPDHSHEPDSPRAGEPPRLSPPPPDPRTPRPPCSPYVRDAAEVRVRAARRCLCGPGAAPLAEALRRPFDRAPRLSEWPTESVLVLLSGLQLVAEGAWRGARNGRRCPRLAEAMAALARDERDFGAEMVKLADHGSPYVTFAAGKLCATLVVAGGRHADLKLLRRVLDAACVGDGSEAPSVKKIEFGLEVVRRILEWKDGEQHPLEEREETDGEVTSGVGSGGSSTGSGSDAAGNLPGAFSNLHATGDADESEGSDACDGSVSFPKTSESFVARDSSWPAVPPPTLPVPPVPPDQTGETVKSGREEDEDEGCCEAEGVVDSEAYDASHAKCSTIKCLERPWPVLVRHVRRLLTGRPSLPGTESCALTFLSLWENIISVKANLSVIDTKPFYMDLQSFVELLRRPRLPPAVYTRLLSLFNEVLCYGSTLALQDVLPEETCSLAHTVVRFVKDFRLLNDVPVKRPGADAGFGFVGRNFRSDGSGSDRDNDGDEAGETDRVMLQKVVLLVLKSVAVTVKEMRCDSSDSSVDSSDFGAIQDMQMVERSIRDVLKKLDVFLKDAMDFLPESPFTKILVRLFSEQDDYLIESMVCTLDITVGIDYRNSVFPDLILMLDPILSFIEFLDIVSHDSDVLLDYLVSNETCFLLYLLRFLKYVRRNWSKFVMSQWDRNRSGSRGLDDTMAVLIRLRLQICRLVSRSLFPYNISPVLKLLEVCENLYEGNEHS